MGLFIILTFALILRLFLSLYGTLPIDFGDWIGWSNRLVEVGFSKFYQNWSDYLPGYLYILWFLGHLKNFLYSLGFQIPLETLYKLPAILADLVLVFLAYKISRKILDQKWALTIAAIFALNPATFANSSLWGQIDALNTLFYILTFIFLFQKRVFLSATSLAISLLIKPQGLFLPPLIFLLIIKEKWPLMEFIKGTFLTLLIFFAAFVPFSDKINIFQFTLERYLISLGQYPYTSLNAFNFWAIGQRWWILDSQILLGLPLQLWGIATFIVIFLLIFWNFWRNYKKNSTENLYFIFLSLALLFLASFIFLTRVHERLLLTPLIFLMLAAIFKKGLWIFASVYSIAYVLNLYFSFVWITQNFRHVFNDALINIISVTNILVFIVLLILSLKKEPFVEKLKTA